MGDELKKNKRPGIYDDDTLSKMRNYYNIEDHTDLLKFIKSNGLHNNDDLDTDYSDKNKKKRIEVDN